MTRRILQIITPLYSNPVNLANINSDKTDLFQIVGYCLLKVGERMGDEK
jgi:hypothetical protein